MDSLAGAQILGGVAIEISADLTGLRAGIATAKTLSAGAEASTKIQVPVTIAGGPLAIRSQVMAAISVAQASVQPIKIPIIFVPSGGGAGIGGGQAGVNGGVRALPGGNSGWTLENGSRRGSNDDFIEGEFVNSPRKMLPGPVQNMFTMGNGYAGPGGGGYFPNGYSQWGSPGQRPGSFFDPSAIANAGPSQTRDQGWNLFGQPQWLRNARTLLRGSGFGRTFAAGLAIREVIGVGGALGALRGSSIVGDPQMQSQLADKYEQDLQTTSLGLRGFFREAVPNLLGYETSAQRDQEQGNIIMGEATRVDARSQQLITRGQSGISISRSVGLQNSGFGKSTGQRGVLQAQSALDVFDTEFGADNLKGPLKQARAELLTALAQSIQLAAAESAAELRSARTSAAGVIGSSAAGVIGSINGSVAGGRAELATQNNSAMSAALDDIQTLHQGGVSLSDPKMRAAMIAAGAIFVSGTQKMAAFNYQVKQSENEEISASQASSGILGLKLSGNDIAAARASIEEQYRQKIDEVKKNYGANSPLIKQLESEEKAADAAAVAPMIRSQTAFIAGSNNRIQDMSSLPGKARDIRDIKIKYQQQMSQFAPGSSEYIQLTKERDAAVSARQSESEYGEMLGPSLADATRATSLATRRAVAVAAGSNEPILSGILGRLGSQSIERMSAPGGWNQVVLAQTQLSELGAMKNEILRPHQFATQGDRIRDVPGGAAGISGKDVTEGLAALTKAMTDLGQIIKDGGGLPN